MLRIADQRYDYAVNFLLKHEGGFANNKADPGGATNYGVSLRFLKAAGIDINMDGKIDITDIMALDKTNAKYVYKKYWWDKYRYNTIVDLDVATKVFDLAVNMGNIQAGRLTQRAVNVIITPRPLPIDGILGEHSFNVINAINAAGKSGQLLDGIKKQACQFYTGLVEHNPDLNVFLKGWLRRAND